MGSTPSGGRLASPNLTWSWSAVNGEIAAPVVLSKTRIGMDCLHSWPRTLILMAKKTQNTACRMVAPARYYHRFPVSIGADSTSDGERAGADQVRQPGKILGEHAVLVDLGAHFADGGMRLLERQAGLERGEEVDGLRGRAGFDCQN